MKQKFKKGDKVTVIKGANKGKSGGVKDCWNNGDRMIYEVNIGSGLAHCYSYELAKAFQDPLGYKVGDKVLYKGTNENFHGKVCTITEIYPTEIYPACRLDRYSLTNDENGTLCYVYPEKFRLLKEGETQETISEEIRLIQEAKDFAAAYFKDRNECVGKEWVDNVTDSWIYDSENFWLEKYHWKYGEDKQPSEEESKAHWDESFRLFDKQYAELFAERDAKAIITGLFEDLVEKEGKAVEILRKLSKNTNNRFVHEISYFVDHMQFMDKRMTDRIKRDIERGHFSRGGFGCGCGWFGF